MLIALLVQCRSDKDKNAGEKDAEALIEEKLGKTLDFSEMPDSLKAAHMVRVWNGCHNGRYIDQLEQLYDNKVFFYGEDKAKWECMLVKKQLFTKYPDYFQRIIGGIDVDYLGSGQYKCTFTKYITLRNITAPVPAYIIFRINEEGRFVIAAESDPQTDTKTQMLKDSLEVLMQLFSPSETEIKGNFSGSGTQETMYIMPPDKTPCSVCITSLFFSNELLPPIDLENTSGANVLNEGDLDGDGNDEFSVMTYNNSAVSPVTIYSFKRGQWIKLANFNVSKQKLMADSEARKNAVQLAGPGYINVQEMAGDTIQEKKIDIWKY